MMTLKVWNTLSKETKQTIINKCGYNVTTALLEEYHHNFDYDATGKKLKEILNCCYLRPSDKKIVVSVEIVPTYAPKESKTTKKVGKTAKVAFDAQAVIRRIDMGYSSAIAVLPSILEKYQDKYYKGVRVNGSFHRNHRIDGFYLYKGKVIVDVYWQGDSTDGNEGFNLTDYPDGKTIPADSYFDGYRTRTRHSDLRVDREEIYNAIKLLKDVIAPKKVEKREPTCCVCGKTLTRTDIHYYDLTDYCIDCAIADGIRTSKD